MKTLDNMREINGALWQKLDLKQEINTALSAHTTGELAQEICLKFELSVRKRSLNIYLIIAEY